MIYSNTDIEKSTKEMKWGTLTSFNIGERNKYYNREITLPSGIKEDVIEKGLNPNITIGQTKSGNPRINFGKDKDIYLLLSSRDGNTKKGSGYISVPAEYAETIDVLAMGGGQDGICSFDSAL